MAYLRGETYIWSDGACVHFWVHDGADGWKESGWAGERVSAAGGVAVSQQSADEYVVMRFAELLVQGEAASIVARAIAAHEGNGGCEALCSIRPSIEAAVGRICGD